MLGGMTKEDTQPQEGLHLKLISVELKEAALDSPSFRASTNFFYTRVEILEDWIQTNMDFAENKLTTSTENFQRVYETLLPHILPSPVMLGNGIMLNQGFAPVLVDEFNKDYYDFSTKLFSIIVGDMNRFSKVIIDLLTDAIEPYKQKRTNFIYYQAKYDSMLSNYQSVNILLHNINPNNIMEDALHLYDIRKSYLEASLELSNETAVFKLKMDKFIIDSIDVLHSSNKITLPDSKEVIDLNPSIVEDLKDYKNWLGKSINTATQLRADMEVVKKQLLEHTLSRIAPSQDIRDYTVKEVHLSILEAVKLKKVPSNSPDNAGWLYMRTVVGTPGRNIWVKRWCFIQNSVFGMFSLSPSKTYVEESDKFGVLLTDIRFESFAQRKFCFHLYISSEQNSQALKADSGSEIVITLQAESLKEVESWFKVFKSAKVYASSLSEKDVEYKVATRRHPPKYVEFASSSITSLDKSVTTVTEHTESLLKLVKGKFADYDSMSILTNNNETVPLYQFNISNTPMTTKLTQLALLSSQLSEPSFFYDAILVNIWGTTSWFEYSVTKVEPNLQNGNGTSLLKFNYNYPTTFTEKDVTIDSEFRSIFYPLSKNHSILPDEFILFSFRSFWFPNKTQGFSATNFISTNYIYSYMNSMGFITLNRKKLSDIVAVEIDKNHPDLVHIYNFDGSFSSYYAYFLKVEVLVAKFKYLLENKLVENPKSGDELLKKLAQIEENIINSNTTALSQELPISLEKRYFTLDESKFNVSNTLEQFKKECTFSYSYMCDIPCKGMMHLIYGDHSTVFSRCLLLSQKDSKYNINWCWNEELQEDGTIHLIRKSQLQLKMKFQNHPEYLWSPLQTSDEIFVTQRIIRMIADAYYEIEQDPTVIQLPFCNPFRLKSKCVISKINLNSARQNQKSVEPDYKCSLIIYYKIEFVNPTTKEVIDNPSLFERIIKHFILLGTQKEFLSIRKLVESYLDRIGKHNKVAKTIKLCGMLAVLKSTSNSTPNSERYGTIHVPNHRVSSSYDISFSLPVILYFFSELLINKMKKAICNTFRRFASLMVYCISNLMKMSNSLFLLLLMSILFNLFYSGRSLNSFWSVRRSNNIIENYIESDDAFRMNCIILLDDLNTLIKDVAVEDDNLAFQTFNQKNSENKFILKGTRDELQIKRNQLLIELRMLESLERDTLYGDYRKFLLSELSKCETVNSDMLDVWKNNTHLQSYCDSCSIELDKLNLLLL